MSNPAPAQNPSEVLLWACEAGTLNRFITAMETGADVNYVGPYGMTPLGRAAFSNHVELCTMLLKKSAQINAQDKLGFTPLHWCCSRSNAHAAVATILIENHADVNIKDGMGNTPLHYAAENGYLDCMQAILKSKPNPKLENRMGQTPYDLAEKHNQMAKQLLEVLGANNRGVGKNEFAVESAPAQMPLRKMTSTMTMAINIDESSSGWGAPVPPPFTTASKSLERQVSDADSEANVIIDRIKKRLMVLLEGDAKATHMLLAVEQKILNFDPIVLIELVPQLRYALFGGLLRVVPTEGGVQKASRILEIIGALSDPKKFQDGVLGLGVPLPPLSDLENKEKSESVDESALHEGSSLGSQRQES